LSTRCGPPRRNVSLRLACRHSIFNLIALWHVLEWKISSDICKEIWGGDFIVVIEPIDTVT
jgi:hypothetical protein